jgi:hypothetical protein
MKAFTAELDQMPWHIYEVRWVIRPRASDPAKAANASRTLHTLTTGSRTQMQTALRELAATRHAVLDDEGGIEQAWLRWRGTTFPAVEHFLVAAPTGPQDKDGRGFEAAWQAATKLREPVKQLALPLAWVQAA